jgi:DNA-binding CsgD family transcriptional regulator
VALALDVLGRVAQQRGDLVLSAKLHAEAAQRLRDLGSPRLVGNLLEGAIVATEIGEPAEVRQFISEIEAIAEERGDSMLTAAVLHLNALVATYAGDASSAADLLEQELAMRRAAGGQQAIIKALTILGHVRVDLKQHRAALTGFIEAIRGAQATGERVRLIRALEGLARCVAVTDADSAVRLASASDGQRRVLGAVPWPSERRYLDDWLTNARRTLGHEAYRRAWEDGHASALDQAVSLAEALAVAPQARVPPPGPLTTREQEVALLLAHGLTNKQIAAKLILSPATVRSHVEHILTRLDLRSRAQVAVWASQQGLLSARSSD